MIVFSVLDGTPPASYPQLDRFLRPPRYSPPLIDFSRTHHQVG